MRDLDAEVGGRTEGGDATVADARDLANQTPVIRFVNLLIREAYEARASDIHLESSREGLRAAAGHDPVALVRGIRGSRPGP